MERKEVVKELNHLLEMDRGMGDAYGKAVDKLRNDNNNAGADSLVSFREDHERHVRDLGSLVSRYGGEPARGTGLTGTMAKGATAIANLGGTSAVLKSMRDNEERSNNTYQKACEKPFPEDVMPTLQKNLEDERKHLAWLNQHIKATGQE